MRKETTIFLCFLVSLAAAASSAHGPFNYLEVVNMQNAKSQLGEENGLSISLSLSKTTLNSSEWITVSWNGVLQPSKNDWIGAFPAPLDLSLTPLKYRFCANGSDTHLTQGSGHMDWFILNMRTDLVFVFFTNGTDYPIAVAASSNLVNTRYNEPTQAHLSLGKLNKNSNGGDFYDMRLTWTTRDLGSTDAEKNAHVVKYGTSPQNLDQTAVANADHSKTYTSNDMCGFPANGTGFFAPGVFHSAILTNLTPLKRYYYSYGNPLLDSEMKEGSFVAPPPVSASSSVRFIAFGDMGQIEPDQTLEQGFMTPSANTTRLMSADVEADLADLIVHIGDISYARGYVGQWEVFMDMIGERLAKKIPYQVAIGNHERDWPKSGSLFEGTDSGGECGVPYARRFNMPFAKNNNYNNDNANVDEDDDVMWYSFNFGPVHFLLISTEHDFAKGSKQYEFVEQDLSSVDRAVTPWVIVGGHRPMYIDSTNNDEPDGDLPVARELRRAFEMMFVKYKVDVYLGAHHHSYQRSHPLIDRIPLGFRHDGSARAPIYFIIGMSGAGVCTNVHKHRTFFMDKLDIEHYGYTRWEANSTHLAMQFVSDEDGQVLDSLTLVH